MDEGKGVEGTNAARDKPMSTDLSAQARARHVARWRRRPFVGTAHAPASARPAPVRSTAQEVKIRCVPAGFSQGPVCESRPGLHTRLGQIGVLGSAGGSMVSQDVSSRAVSKDNQRLHDWTQDEPVDDLRLDP